MLILSTVSTPTSIGTDLLVPSTKKRNFQKPKWNVSPSLFGIFWLGLSPATERAG